MCFDDYWEPDCSCYRGTCCASCAGTHDGNGCNDNCYDGPSSYDCAECAVNAYRGFDGACYCLEDWSRHDAYCQDDCTTYTGMCSWHCATCTGPEASDCVQCFPHAIGGNCACEDNWGGMDCEVYMGECAPVCNGCTGPTAWDCVHCHEFAARVVEEIDGVEIAYCKCLDVPQFGPADSCNKFYQGHCHETCFDPNFGGDGDEDICWGPNSYQCYECIEHSYRDYNGACMCEDNYNGELDCSTYNGSCDCICLGCSGPSASECDACQANATLNSDGMCECNDGWGGCDCSEWQGECDCKCTSCDFDSCYSCVENAHQDGDTCTCDDGWNTDSCCTTFEGTCAPTCAGTCGNGANPSDCDECILHAYRAPNGDCICEENWGGADC